MAGRDCRRGGRAAALHPQQRHAGRVGPLPAETRENCWPSRASVPSRRSGTERRCWKSSATTRAERGRGESADELTAERAATRGRAIPRQPAASLASPPRHPSHYWTQRLLSAGFTVDECAAIRGSPREVVLEHARSTRPTNASLPRRRQRGAAGDSHVPRRPADPRCNRRQFAG